MTKVGFKSKREQTAAAQSQFTGGAICLTEELAID
jgi:hypothetical protein